ncbi:MAG: hypothetical protein ABIY48_12465 [Acidimicrobiales bacterium]
MDLRVLLLIADRDLGELVRAQVDNLGCASTLAETYDTASTSLAWADAVVIDLAGEGLDDLYRVRLEAPTVHVLAIAPDEERAASARSAGVHRALVEPFSVADIVDGLRAMGPSPAAATVDLRTGVRSAAPALDDAPWWVTR